MGMALAVPRLLLDRHDSSGRVRHPVRVTGAKRTYGHRTGVSVPRDRLRGLGILMVLYGRARMHAAGLVRVVCLLRGYSDAQRGQDGKGVGCHGRLPALPDRDRGNELPRRRRVRPHRARTQGRLLPRLLGACAPAREPQRRGSQGVIWRVALKATVTIAAWILLAVPIVAAPAWPVYRTSTGIVIAYPPDWKVATDR